MSACTCQKAASGMLGWDRSMIDPECPEHGHEAPPRRDTSVERIAIALDEDAIRECGRIDAEALGLCIGENTARKVVATYLLHTDALMETALNLLGLERIDPSKPPTKINVRAQSTTTERVMILGEIVELPTDDAFDAVKGSVAGLLTPEQRERYMAWKETSA